MFVHTERTSPAPLLDLSLFRIREFSAANATTFFAYAAIGIYLAVQKKKSMTTDRRMSDFDRMGHAAERRPTTHAMVHDLDETDRRLMAIDHHINTQNEELAREIEALRQEDK